METATSKKTGNILPDNAYTKLAPGEEYKPIVPPEDRRAEVTIWSVTVGLVMVLVFSAACVYMALRAANAIEAAIPIAIMAIFLGSKGLKRSGKSTILENVIVQSIGQAAGVVAAGSAFLIPALYINQLNVQWWQIFLACCIGGFLGIVLIIPLRKYFVKDLHGDLPFPEATAINEILVSGESTSKSAGKVLLAAFGLGAAYDFAIEALHAWNPMMTTKSLLGWIGKGEGFGKWMSDLRLDVSMNGLAALFGLGYIIGLRYAAIIASGSVFAYLVLIPLIYHFGSQIPEFVYAGKTHVISQMSSADIFDEFVKPIGIGAIAVSGIIGIIRMGKIVLGSISLGFKGLKGGGAAENVPRTQLDMTPRNVLLVQFGSTLLMAILFFVIGKMLTGPDDAPVFTTNQCLLYAVVGAVVGFILSFLFTPVAAQAIAIVGVNPVSGMTLITVVLTIVVLMATGLKGEGGMFIALIVGCAVCTALSTSGALISDFKIGYWIGSTPRNQEVWKFAGVILAALVVAFVIPIMDSGYHFLKPGTTISNSEVLPAPQANMMAEVSKGLLADPASRPWLLYGLGGCVAIMLYMAGVPMLAFALGIYIPIFTNVGVLAGAFAAHIVGKTGGSEKVRKARRDQGILIASGLMAGAAIFGIVAATMRLTAVGAPIQYISIGVDFELEKVGAGEDSESKKTDDANKDANDSDIKNAGSGEEFDTKETDDREEVLKGTPEDWYKDWPGQYISLVMFVYLALACFYLAKKGADWSLREEEAAEKANSS
ncbi:MAG: oligopeptide transporter, OPT family [Pirellulales bacterium]|nr:oligopeptide transporter, OPT family [Pirellulales bacterium]